MAYTLDDMTFLTAPQKAAVQALAAVGAQIVTPSAGGGPILGLTPPLTLSNTKRAAEMMQNLDDLWRDVRKGINYSITVYRYNAQKALDDANP